MFFPAADTIAFSEGGVESMRLDSNGNLGIGTNSPAYRLQVETTSATGNIVGYFRQGSGAVAAIQSSTDLVGFGNGASSGQTRVYADGGSGFVTVGTAGTERMRITSTGNVGIGTDVPAAKFSVSTGDSKKQFIVSTTNDPVVQIGLPDWYNVGVLAFVNGSDGERMRIDASGNVLIGTTSSLARVVVQSSSTNDSFGSFYVQNTNTAADACIAAFATATNSTDTSNVYIKFGINNYAAGGGQITANGAAQAAFGAFSDSRLKENIVDLPAQLANITALRPVEFDYIESEGGGHQTGFIAQEMQEIYPDAVGERADGMLTVTGWNKTEARLVKAIQEQQAMIEELKAKVAALEAA
jgi:hypothetical protein